MFRGGRHGNHEVAEIQLCVGQPPVLAPEHDSQSGFRPVTGRIGPQALGVEQGGAALALSGGTARRDLDIGQGVGQRREDARLLEDVLGPRGHPAGRVGKVLRFSARTHEPEFPETHVLHRPCHGPDIDGKARLDQHDRCGIGAVHFFDCLREAFYT